MSPLLRADALPASDRPFAGLVLPWIRLVSHWHLAMPLLALVALLIAQVNLTYRVDRLTKEIRTYEHRLGDARQLGHQLRLDLQVLQADAQLEAAAVHRGLVEAPVRTLVVPVVAAATTDPGAAAR